LKSGRLVDPIFLKDMQDTFRQSKKPLKPELAARYPGLDKFIEWFYDWNIPTDQCKRRRVIDIVAPAKSRRRNVAKALRARDEPA
jgi:hypothetical protein